MEVQHSQEAASKTFDRFGTSGKLAGRSTGALVGGKPVLDGHIDVIGSQQSSLLNLVDSENS